MRAANGPLREQPAEEDPLIPAMRPSRPRSALTLLPLLCICLLERCTFYEYVADVLNSQPSNNDTNYCGILGDNSTVNLSSSWQSHTLLGLAFMMPLLGGFVADWHCGGLRVLQFGCALYCLGAWMMVCLVYISMLCTSVFKYLCQTVLALGAGLIRPNLMVMSYEIGQPLLGTIGLCHLYYACEAAGQFIGCLLAYITDIEGRPLTASCVPTTHAMIGLAVCCTVGVNRSGWDPSMFQLPTWPRIRRILIVGWPIILLSSILMLASFTFSGWELTHLANQRSQKDLMMNSDQLLLVWSVALLAAVASLALLTHRVVVLRSHIARIAIGIVVIGVSQFVAFGLLSGLTDKNAPRNALNFAYDSQSVLGAVGEALTYIAANEIAFKIAPVEIRTFILGLFMSLKGSGFVTSIIILMVYLNTSDMQNFHGMSVAFVHLGLGIALFAALLFFLRFAPRALSWLLDIEEANRRAEAIDTPEGEVAYSRIS